MKRLMKVFCCIILIICILAAAGYVWSSYREWFVHPVFSDSTRAKHVIVISVDALGASDYEKIKDLPNFSSLMENGSYVQEVECVYPSLTYPSHTSIITGTYPDKHGIINNEHFQPGVPEPEWFWYRKDIKVPTLYDLARESGMRVGAFLWPVTAKAAIDYNLPEIKAREGQNQIIVALTNGTPLFLLDINNRFGKIRNGIHQPELDDFVTESVKYLIKSKKPNLLMIHLTDLDKYRHEYGTASDEAMQALERQDRRIGEIMQSARDAGIYEDTAFVILGDHSFLDTNAAISLNAAFKNEGLIETGPDGKLAGWKAFAHSCEGSAYIYLKDKNDGEVSEKVEAILSDMAGDPGSGIEAVYGKDM